MNSRPTVYEDVAFANGSEDFDDAEAQGWAHDALVELGQGGHALAGALLATLVARGYPGAGEALAEVAAGRWAGAIELLRPLAAAAVRSAR